MSDDAAVTLDLGVSTLSLAPLPHLNLSLVKMSYGDTSLFVQHDHTIACLQWSWVYNRARLCISHRGLALGSEGENIFLIYNAEV